MPFAQVNGGQLPAHVLPFCGAAALLAALLPVAAFFLARAETRLRERPAAANAPQVLGVAASWHVHLIIGVSIAQP